MKVDTKIELITQDKIPSSFNWVETMSTSSTTALHTRCVRPRSLSVSFSCANMLCDSSARYIVGGFIRHMKQRREWVCDAIKRRDFNNKINNWDTPTPLLMGIIPFHKRCNCSNDWKIAQWPTLRRRGSISISFFFAPLCSRSSRSYLKDETKDLPS